MKSLLLLLLLFFSLSIQSQNLEKVFDDGGLSTIKNNVHFSVSDMIEGYLNIGYDRYIGQHSSIGVTVGVYLFNGQGLYYFFGDNTQGLGTIHDFDKGYLIRFQFRSFLFRNDGFFWQYGIMFRQLQNTTHKYSFLSIPEAKFGYQYEITNRITATASVGFGLGLGSLQKVGSQTSDWGIGDSGFYMPLNIDIHYNF